MQRTGLITADGERWTGIADERRTGVVGTAAAPP
jgi:hypothetical protein